MRFRITGYDDDGKPTHVATDDGYMQTSRQFDEDTDGWMLDQLRMSDFDAIVTGRQVESLVLEVNELRRENFRLNKSLKVTDRLWGIGES